MKKSATQSNVALEHNTKTDSMQWNNNAYSIAD